MFASRPQKPEPDSFVHVTRGPQIRSSRKIGRSIQQITGIISSSPQNKKKRECSIKLLMHKSGVKFIAPHDTIWRSAILF
jgi:hypothetical protein